MNEIGAQKRVVTSYGWMLGCCLTVVVVFLVLVGVIVNSLLPKEAEAEDITPTTTPGGPFVPTDIYPPGGRKDKTTRTSIVTLARTIVTMNVREEESNT